MKKIILFFLFFNYIICLKSYAYQPKLPFCTDYKKKDINCLEMKKINKYRIKPKNCFLTVDLKYKYMIQDSIDKNKNYIEEIKLSPNHNYLAMRDRTNIIKIFNLKTNKIINLIEHTNDVLAIDFSPNNKILASSSLDGSIKIWDINKGILIKTIFKQRFPISDVKFSKDGSLLASSSSYENLMIWDTKTWIKIKSISGNYIYQRKISFLNDNNSIINSDIEKNTFLINKIKENKSIKDESKTHVKKKDSKVNYSKAVPKTLKNKADELSIKDKDNSTNPKESNIKLMHPVKPPVLIYKNPFLNPYPLKKDENPEDYYSNRNDNLLLKVDTKNKYLLNLTSSYNQGTLTLYKLNINSNILHEKYFSDSLILSADISPNSEIFSYISNINNEIVTNNIDNLERINTLVLKNKFPTSLTFLDNNNLISCYNDGYIRFWNLKNKKVYKYIKVF